MKTLSFLLPVLTASFDLPEAFGSYKNICRMPTAANMGIIYKAFCETTGRDAAIKVISTEKYDIHDLSERFKKEARALESIHHPNVCNFLETGEIDGQYYLAMDWIDGYTLREAILNREFSEPVEAAKLIYAIANALTAIHNKEIIHRDIKPANILINHDGQPIVVDFGIVRTKDSTMTTVGVVLGTPSYMSPEQARGEKIDDQSDIFSLGIVFYELLTGSLPLPGIVNIINLKEADPPSKHRPDIDPVLDGICLKALAKHKEQRYTTAEQMARDLDSYINSHVFALETVDRGSRFKNLVIAAAIALVGILILFITMMYSN